MHKAWSPVTQPAVTRTVRVTGSTRTPLIVDKSQILVDAGEFRCVFGPRREWRSAARRAISNGRTLIAYRLPMVAKIVETTYFSPPPLSGHQLRSEKVARTRRQQAIFRRKMGLRARSP